ncbi:MAG: gliding motility-associated C-terminal domain-containing protein [Lewinella sp.]|nr:gliding motility-associated C-terminal domain-containing protein [Lewinella sp.]
MVYELLDGPNNNVVGIDSFLLSTADSLLSICPSAFGLSSLVTYQFRFLSIRDGSGCRANTVGTYQVYGFDAATDTVRTQHCVGETVRVAGQDFTQANPQGTVVLMGQSVNGCDSIVVVDLTFVANVNRQLDTILCFGGELVLEGNVFNAANPSGSFLSAAPSASGCDSTVNVQLNFLTPLLVRLVAIEGACSDSSFTLVFDYSGSDSLQLVLSNTNQTQYTLASGNSRLLVTPTGPSIALLSAAGTTGNCPLQASGQLSVPRVPSLAVSVVAPISCAEAADGRLRATLTSGNPADFQFSWNTGATGAELGNLSPGTYVVTALNAAGCAVTAEATLVSPIGLRLAASTLAGDCLGNLPRFQIDSISGGQGPYLYRVNSGVFVPLGGLPLSATQPAGQLTLEVQDANGCNQTATLNLAEAPEPQLLLGPIGATVNLGDSIQLNAQTNLRPVFMRWQSNVDGLLDSLVFVSGTTLSRYVQPTQNTIYTLSILDSAGCSVSAELLVRVDRRVPVYAPTSFSPNGDGVNDVFTFYGERGVLAFSNFMVFDRWGEAVFRADGSLVPNDLSWAWSGIYRTQLLPPGVYVYSIQVLLADGRSELLKGEVILLR